MQRTYERQAIFPIPIGGNATAIGDSITSNVSAGQWAAFLASRYAWTLQGLTDPVVNGQMETNATGWNTVVNCTLTRDNTCPGISNITGAWALKVAVTANGLVELNCGGDTGALRLNMLPNVYQTFGTAVWLPAGYTSNCYIQMVDRIGAGAQNFTNSTAVTGAGGTGLWVFLAIVRLLPVGTTEACVRIVMDAPSAGQAIWLDAAFMLHANGVSLPAVGGAALATAAACGNGNSILDSFAARITAFPAPLYLLMAGTNDYFAMTDAAWVAAHGGPLYTPVEWGVAVRSAITQILALSGHPALIVFGVPPAKAALPGIGRLPSYATSGQNLRDQMDAQTREACLENHVPFVPLNDMPLAYTDGIHPDASLLASGQQGHSWMAQRFTDVMNRAVK